MTNLLPFDPAAIGHAELAEVVAKARKRADLSQTELGRLLGKRRATIASWETGANKISAVDFINLLDLCGYVFKILPVHKGPPSTKWAGAGRHAR